jgi:hypothetical protein
MLELRDGTRKNWQASATHTDLHKTNTRWLVPSRSTFGVRTSHGQLGFIRFTTAQTWGKPPPSPLYYILYLSMGATSKWHFVPGLPSGSLEISKLGTSVTLGAHNFLCRPPIDIRSEEKLYPFSRAFQWYMAHYLHASKSGQFLTFSGRESNSQFDSRPFFWP